MTGTGHRRWKWLVSGYVLVVLFAPPLPFTGPFSQLRIADFVFAGLVFVFFASPSAELKVPKDLLVSLLCYLAAYAFGVGVTVARTPESTVLAVAYFGKFLQYAAIFVVLFSIFTAHRPLRRRVRTLLIGALILNAVWVLILEVVSTEQPTGIGTSSIFITAYLLSFLTLLSAPDAILSKEQVETKLLPVSGTVVGLLALFANESRAILVGTIMGLGVTLAYFSWYSIILLAAVGVVGIGFLSTVDVPGLRRITELRHVLTDPTSIRSLRIRFVRWQEGIDIWMQNPITGRGLATVTDELFIENLYIVFFAEMGIIGFVLFSIAAVFFTRFFIRHLSADRAVRSALVGLSIICVLAVTGFFSLSLWGIRSMELFSIIVALLAAHFYEETLSEGISNREK